MLMLNFPFDSNYSSVASKCCLISYFDARKFWCIFVLAILKTNPFSYTCISATSFKIWTFSAYCIALNRLERIFLNSLHIIFIMYIIRSETFIDIDLLQHLKGQLSRKLPLFFKFSMVSYGHVMSLFGEISDTSAKLIFL